MRGSARALATHCTARFEDECPSIKGPAAALTEARLAQVDLMWRSALPIMQSMSRPSGNIKVWKRRPDPRHWAQPSARSRSDQWPLASRPSQSVPWRTTESGPNSPSSAEGANSSAFSDDGRLFEAIS